jgi:hypothetical protein
MNMCDATTRVPGRRQVAERRAASCRPRVRAGLLLASVLALGACDFPTGLPRFEPRFVVPLESTVFHTHELLPAGITSNGTTFQLNLQPVSSQRTLGTLCGAPCVLLNGQTAPKPAFSHTFATVFDLPADVVAAVIASGSVEVTTRHSFDFDPLRPAGSVQDGTLTIVVRSSGRQLGTAVINQQFPAGTQIVRTIGITPGEIGSSIEVELTIHSPAGGPAVINTAASLHATGVPAALHLAEVRAAVSNRTISMQALDVNLTGIEDEIRSRARGGALVLEVSNPFDVSGELELRLLAPPSGADYRKPVGIAHGETTQRIALDHDELFRLLGFNVNVSLSGPVSANASTITLRPGQQVSLRPRLELTLGIGG